MPCHWRHLEHREQLLLETLMTRTGRTFGGAWSRLSGIMLAAIVALPAHAQLPFTLRDCLADRDEDARLHICSIMSGTDEEKADRKSTRLNSSHVKISYAVFCLKKKKQ